MEEQKCLPPMPRETILSGCVAFLEGDILDRDDILELVGVIESHDLLTDDEIYPVYVGMLRALDRDGGI
jgi:hypothetical protein